MNIHTALPEIVGRILAANSLTVIFNTATPWNELVRPIRHGATVGSALRLKNYPGMDLVTPWNLHGVITRRGDKVTVSSLYTTHPNATLWNCHRVNPTAIYRVRGELWPCGTLLCGYFSSTESTGWETVSEPHGLMADWLETLVKFNYARKYNKAELELKYVSSPAPVHPLCLSASARV